MQSFKLLRVALLSATLAIPTLAVGASSVFAYGHADQPLAQIEISGNCNNPSFPLCAAPPDGVGVGGIWVWIEIDANGTGDVAGAACGHNVGGPGGGAFPIRGEITWSYASASDLPAGAVLLTDPGDSYYWVPEVFDLAIPVTPGHYSFHPVAGVSLQIQVAP